MGSYYNQTMSSFSVSIDQTQLTGKTLEFHLSGSDEYGLDKSIVNSLRRTLLSEIPCVAFRVSEESEKDIVITLNNTSLHNEYLMHRLAMVPIILDPETYENQYLFYLNVKHDQSYPFRFVTTDDIQIFPLKKDVEPSSPISLDDYDMKKPVSKQIHNEIFPPFEFRGKSYPILLTELKSTNVKDQYQELCLYGVPSVGDAREHACWKGVSEATYTFLPDTEMFETIANQKAGQQNILDDEERIRFIESLRLSESERYFYRDIYNEPHRYTFRITPVHIKTAKELFLASTEILITKLETIKQHCINVTKGGDTTITIKPHTNEFTYCITMYGQNDTIGNVLQSHIVNKHIDDTSLVTFCGYKKSHPLEEHILVYLGLNPTVIGSDTSEEMKINQMIKFLDEITEELMGMYRMIGIEATKML